MGKIVKVSGKRKAPVVKVCIPYYDAMPQPGMILNEQLVYWGIPGYDTHIFKQQGAIIEFARNDLVNTEPDMDYDFVFFIDADIGFDKDTMTIFPQGDIPIMIKKMKTILDHDLFICGGYYTMRAPPHLPTVYTHLEGDVYSPILNPPKEGVLEVGALATGFLCIKKAVFDRFAKHNKDVLARVDNAKLALKNLEELAGADIKLQSNVRQIKEAMAVMKPAAHPPFWVDYPWDPFKEKYVQMGEDIYFCNQARKLGYKIYCDFSVEVGHESKYYPTPDKYRDAFMEECVHDFMAHAEENSKLAEHKHKVMFEEKKANG